MHGKFYYINIVLIVLQRLFTDWQEEELLIVL